MPYGSDELTLNCTKCGEIKPESEFSRESKNTRRNFRRTDCKSCVYTRQKKRAAEPGVREHRTKTRRVWSRLNKYGFTPGLYEQRLEEQGNACAICKTKEPGGRGQFHADHDHKTGRPRGVLCHSCNVSLGGFKDNLEALAAAIEYLKKYSEDK